MRPETFENFKCRLNQGSRVESCVREAMLSELNLNSDASAGSLALVLIALRLSEEEIYVHVVDDP